MTDIQFDKIVEIMLRASNTMLALEMTEGDEARFYEELIVTCQQDYHKLSYALDRTDGFLAAGVTQ